MLRCVIRCLVLALVAAPSTAIAEPSKLNLAFFSSDRSVLYMASVKPFVDAINSEANGLIEIQVHPAGGLGKVPSQQADLVRQGTADIAFIVPGYTPERFPDNGVIELPGLFRDGHEATQVYGRLIAANALRGYEEFFVIGAYATEPESIHSRVPITALRDLKGLKIRANNPMEAAALEKLGMSSIIMPVNYVSQAISTGKIDATAIPPSPLIEFGIGRVVANHYCLRVSSAPMALVMSKKKFDRLSPAAQALVRKYSGAWMGTRYSRTYATENDRVLQLLRSEPERTVTSPTDDDLRFAKTAFTSVVEEWRAQSPRNNELLKAAERELAQLRAHANSNP